MRPLASFENKHGKTDFKCDGLDCHPFKIEDFFKSLQIENEFEIQNLYYFTIDGVLDDILYKLKKGIKERYEKWVDIEKIVGVYSRHHSKRFYNDWTPVKEEWDDDDSYYKRFKRLEEKMIKNGIENGMKFLYELHHQRGDQILLACYNDLYWVESGLHRISIAKRTKYPKIYAKVEYFIPTKELKEKYEDAIDYLFKLIDQSSNTIDLKTIKEIFEENFSIYQKSIHSHHNTGSRTIKIKQD